MPFSIRCKHLNEKRHLIQLESFMQSLHVNPQKIISTRQNALELCFDDVCMTVTYVFFILLRNVTSRRAILKVETGDYYAWNFSKYKTNQSECRILMLIELFCNSLKKKVC